MKTYSGEMPRAAQVPFRDAGNTKNSKERLNTSLTMAQLAFGSDKYHGKA